jgi:hypothetical protein
VVLYALGLFSKESLIAFLPVYAVSAWVVTPRLGRSDWGKLALALLPLGAVLALYVAIRINTWGNLGNYPWARTDYQTFFWDALISHTRTLMSPINPAIFGGAPAQVVGALASLGLLVGLVFFGRSRYRMLALAGAFVLLAIVPVLNLPIRADNFENTRFLYLSAAGYCIGAAVLLHAAVAATWRHRRIALGVVGSVLLLAVGACWVHLRNWHTATVLTQEMVAELREVIPPQPNPAPKSMAWYVEALPQTYRGAYVALQGFDRARLYDAGDDPEVKQLPSVLDAPLAAEPRSAFALRYYFDEPLTRFRLNYAAGITGDSPPPAGGVNLKVWDFRECSPDVLRRWRVIGATISCERGNGLRLDEPGGDSQMLSPGEDFLGEAQDARFVRVRVSVSYAQGDQAALMVSQLFWRGPEESWAEERSQSLPIKLDGQPHVYWNYLPASQITGDTTRLRFDPANGSVPATIRWVALDVVR